MTEAQDPKAFKHEPIPPPAKKARTSPDPPKTVHKEPKVEETNAHGLPPLLSPTLPPEIEEELARATLNMRGDTERVSHNKTLSQVSASSGKKTPSTVASPYNPDVTKSKEKEKPAESKKPRSDSSAAKKVVKGQTEKASESAPKSMDQKQNMPKSNQKYADKTVTSNGHTGAKPLLNGTSKLIKERPASTSASVLTSEKVDQKSRILIFKFPKNLRKNFARIIQMKPRPKKPDPGNNPPHINPDTSKEKAKGNVLTNGAAVRDVDGLRQEQQPDKSRDSRVKDDQNGKFDQLQNEIDAAAKTGQKHRRPDEGINSPSPLPSKRQKPSTPTRPTNKSPVLSQHSSTQKTQLSTPKRDIKSAAMHRIGSAEGDVQTPLGAARSSTPNAPSSINLAGTNSIAGNNPEDLTLWKAENAKYLNLGRTLKHDADAFLKPNGNAEVNDKTTKQGIAIAVETVICYMLAFAINDEIARINRRGSVEVTGWRSLLPYLDFVKNKTSDIKPLHGLVHQLEAICRERILRNDLERNVENHSSASPSHRPHSSSTASDTGATAGDSTDKPLHPPHPSATKPSRSHIMDNFRSAQQAWVRGLTHLSVDDLWNSYPQTWARRAQVPVDEKLVPGKYMEKEFCLPLGVTSSGVEAVRMGWCFLGEWCKMELVKWEGKMGL